MRILLIWASILLLAACGGSDRPSETRAPSSSAVRFATGPISVACIRADRRKASQARCGCIQAVADQALNPVDQKRGAGYFLNPSALQETRQSNAPGDERFWDRWTSYSEQAQKMCRTT